MNDSIILSDYKATWPEEAKKEIGKISSIIPSDIVKKIAHIGSTSIVGLTAKPIIDIAICVNEIDDGLRAVKPLESIDYIFGPDNSDKTHLFFVKGMSPYGKVRTHHVHFFEESRYKEHIKFKNILSNNKEVLDKYSNLKEKLAIDYKDDREVYANLKGKFIRDILSQGL